MHEGAVMNSNRTKKGDGGFTLIELLITVTIIGILAAIAIPGLLSALNKSRQTATAANLRQVAVAVEVYNGENARYPVTNDINLCLVLVAAFNSNLKPRDDWKNPIGFQSDGDNYTVESFGLDGIDGPNVTPATRYIFTLDIVYSNGAFIASVD